MEKITHVSGRALLLGLNVSLAVCFGLLYSPLQKTTIIKIPLGEGNYLERSVWKYKVDVNSSWDSINKQRAENGELGKPSSDEKVYPVPWKLLDETMFYHDDNLVSLECVDYDSDVNDNKMAQFRPNARNFTTAKAGALWLGQDSSCDKKSKCNKHQNAATAGLVLLTIASVVLTLLVFTAVRYPDKESTLAPLIKSIVNIVIAGHFIGIFICSVILYSYFQLETHIAATHSEYCGDDLDSVKEEVHYVDDHTNHLSNAVLGLSIVEFILGLIAVGYEIKLRIPKVYSALHQNFL